MQVSIDYYKSFTSHSPTHLLYLRKKGLDVNFFQWLWNITFIYPNVYFMPGHCFTKLQAYSVNWSHTLEKIRSSISNYWMDFGSLSKLEWIKIHSFISIFPLWTSSNDFQINIADVDLHMLLFYRYAVLKYTDFIITIKLYLQHLL